MTPEHASWHFLQVSTAQASHTRHLGEAAQLRQELRQLSSRLALAEADQQHLEATCKQVTATAEAEWAVKVSFFSYCYIICEQTILAGLLSRIHWMEGKLYLWKSALVKMYASPTNLYREYHKLHSVLYRRAHDPC